MIIKKVKICGFDKLFDGFKYAYENEAFKSRRQAFGNQLIDYLKHLMITINLNDLSTIELFYLKKFCSDLKVIDKVYGNFVDPEKDDDVYQKVTGLLELHNQMLNDDDINKDTSVIDNILPIGCERYHVIAMFSGGSITSITGIMMDSLFMENNQFVDVYPGDLQIEKVLAGLFYNKFYQFMSEKMTELDLVTEFMLQKKFYDFTDGVCNLSHVNSPTGELVFFGNTGNRLNKQLENYKKAQASCPYYLEDKTYLTFALKTTFHTFFKIYLNTKYIVDNKNLKIVFANDMIDVDNPILDKYNARLSSFVNFIASFKKGLSEKQQIDLNKFNYIFNGTEIEYTIQIPMNEVKDFVNDFFVDETELENIKDDMIKIHSTVENLIM